MAGAAIPLEGNALHENTGGVGLMTGGALQLLAVNRWNISFQMDPVVKLDRVPVPGLGAHGLKFRVIQNETGDETGVTFGRAGTGMQDHSIGDTRLKKRCGQGPAFLRRSGHFVRGAMAGSAIRFRHRQQAFLSRVLLVTDGTGNISHHIGLMKRR